MQRPPATIIDIKKEKPDSLPGVKEQPFSFKRIRPNGCRRRGEFPVFSLLGEITGGQRVWRAGRRKPCRDLGGGRLMMRKQAGGGVTVAAAVRDWKVKL